ncbi:hypothetical protein E3N88_24628 [Mikania micrantha]|uniref:Aminotransferase-like plant mobile domain-containing protein n=1 Tax=Mikania micrantha TaxID=192012 RepID=A0A5N6N421_9ASTR|nr:hypothetical protein E3N88_24628 [Mikania micrantha]
MNLGVNPGPLNEDVLFLSDTHRARALFTNTIPDNVQLNVVSDIDYVCPIEQNVAKCAELLGFTPQQKDITGGRIKLARILREIKSDFPENPTELQTVQRARWRSNLSYSQTIAHVVKGFRSQLTELHESMFKWTPYNHVLSLLPPICTSDANCWRCETYIIYWEIVEYHAPSRVTRQFNILQKIPNALPIDKAEHKRLHALTRQGKANKDWRREHHHYMQAWDGRFFNVVNGEFNNVAGVSIDYMQWFWKRTVLHITNPGHHEANPHGYQNHGGRFQVMVNFCDALRKEQRNEYIPEFHIQFLRAEQKREENLEFKPVDGVTQMYQMTGNLIGTYPENAQQLEPLRDMAIDFMGIRSPSWNSQLEQWKTEEQDMRTFVSRTLEVHHVEAGSRTRAEGNRVPNSKFQFKLQATSISSSSSNLLQQSVNQRRAHDSTTTSDDRRLMSARLLLFFGV